LKNTEVLKKQDELLKVIDALSEEKKLREILGKQTIFNDYLDELEAIINDPRPERQRKCGSIFSIVVDSFDYGVMIGKRLERAKHKRG